MNHHQTEHIAHFVASISHHDIPGNTTEQLKRHLLDAIGSLIQAQGSSTVAKLAVQIKSLKPGGDCRTPLLGNMPVDRAAQWYTALIRFPDFMDNFIGKEATCHPSDNIGPLLAACQHLELEGGDFLLAMAIAYTIECTLVEEFPVMVKGFDHTMLYAYSVTAALSKLFELSIAQTAHALGMAGASFAPLVTSRASYTYEWKGLASSMVALGCMNIVLLAKENCTGPVSIFEGPKGLSDIVGMDLKHDWSKDDLGIIRRCVLKRYNAEVHTQSSLEAVEEILRENSPDPESIESVKVTTFLTAYHIVGGGVYGDRKVVSSKEQADHSLPFVLAVMLLDRQVYPGQFTDERINREDVQELMKKITVDTVSPLHKPLPFAGILDPYTDAYPEKLKTRVVIRLKDGQEITRKKDDYHGFYTRPFGWDDCIAKFKKLTEGLLSDSSSDRIIGMVRNLENYKVNDLLALSQAKEVPSSVAG